MVSILANSRSRPRHGSRLPPWRADDERCPPSWITVNKDNSGFVLASTGHAFVPWGFNCSRDFREAGHIDIALDSLARYDIGKPIVAEETFPLKCMLESLKSFRDLNPNR